MADALVQVIGNVVLLAIYGVDALTRDEKKRKAEEEKAASSRLNRSLPSLASTSESPRAVSIDSSSASFAHDCERVVNIAFQTSQTFPSMMGNCAEIQQYLRQELAKLYADETFHIIISENQSFGFAVDNGQHFVEIEYGRYQVLIFSTKRNPNVKLDTHDANSQMKFKWK